MICRVPITQGCCEMKYVNIHKASGAEPDVWLELSKQRWYYYVTVICYYCYFSSTLNVTGRLCAAPSLTLYPPWDQTQHLTGSLLKSNWIPKVLVKKKKCRLYSRLLGGNLEDDNTYYKAKHKKNSPFKHPCSFSKVPLSTQATSSLLPAQIFSMTFGSFSSRPDTSSLGFTFLGRQGG